MAPSSATECALTYEPPVKAYASPAYGRDHQGEAGCNRQFLIDEMNICVECAIALRKFIGGLDGGSRSRTFRGGSLSLLTKAR
jgi:hypothetical protein